MAEMRRITVQGLRCIGCRACTSSCPAGWITRTDEDDTRTIKFPATCAEACTRCRDVCQEAAITLDPASADLGEGSVLKFPLIRCPECRAPFITDRMMTKIREAVTRQIQPVDPSWISICPSCRRAGEAGHMVGMRKGVV